MTRRLDIHKHKEDGEPTGARLTAHPKYKRQKERQRHRQREKQAPCREPDVGLDPRTPGSHPEPKADAQPLSYPGSLSLSFCICEMELIRALTFLWGDYEDEMRSTI